MPQAEFSVERFDREYPEQLPARLKWLEDHLRIGRDRMLRLMGLPRREAATARNRAWPKLVKDYELQAEQLEQLLTHYLAYFDYDVEKAKAFARDFSQKLAAGTHRLSDSIPALASAKTPVDNEAALIEAARLQFHDFGLFANHVGYRLAHPGCKLGIVKNPARILEMERHP